MSVRKKTYGFLTLVTLFAVAGYLVLPYLDSGLSVSSANSTEVEKTEEETKVPVEVVTARIGDISFSIGSTANLRAKREVSVSSRAEGIVKHVAVEEGDFVQENQLLCRLDDYQSQIRLQSAKQKLAQAMLQLEKAGILKDKSEVQVDNNGEELERYQKLFEEQLVSEREVAQIRYRLEELEHDLRVSSSESRELTHRVEELEAEIQQTELEIARAEIRAPFPGLITERAVDVGQTVRNLDPLFKLGDVSPLQADVFLSEREAAEIAEGQKVDVFSGVDGSLGVRAVVARISPIVDQSTGTVKVTVELSRPRKLFKPGAFVRVEIQTDVNEGSVLVPKRAVVEEDGEKSVFVVDDESVRRVQVDVGYENDGQIEILNGVSAGDAVVVAGQGGLKEGSKIKLIEANSDHSA